MNNSTLLLFTKQCNNECGVHLMNRNSPAWNAMPQNA